MEKYKVVKPENYTKEHIEYINKCKSSTSLLSEQTNLMFGVKDVNLRFITGTDTSAKTLGLNSGADFMGRLVADLPCESVAKYAKQISQQEQDLINTCDVTKSIEALSVFKYTDGLKARVMVRRLFYHQASVSILGVSNSAADTQLRDFINIIPSYVLRFGAIGSLDATSPRVINNSNVVLAEYEQEICFLFVLGWNFQQTADFMNIFRPDATHRTADTLAREKSYICQKFNLKDINLKNLCEYLFSIGFHNKIPTSFYSRMIGSKIIN